jgi:hypothetical protein
MLVVGVSIRDGNKSVTSATFNGVPLAFLGAQNSPGNQNRVEIWYLANPDVTTANVRVDLDSGVRVAGGAVSLTSVAPLPGGFQSASGNSALPAILSLLGSPADVVLDTLAANGDAYSAAPDPLLGTDQTERWNTGTGTGGGDIIGAGSTQPGSLLLGSSNWTLGTSKPWSLGAVTLNPPC